MVRSDVYLSIRGLGKCSKIDSYHFYTKPQGRNRFPNLHQGIPGIPTSQVTLPDNPQIETPELDFYDGLTFMSPTLI